MADKKGHYYYTKEEMDELVSSNTSSKYIIIGDVLICWGSVTISNVGTGTYGEAAASITFPKQFSSAPTLTTGVKDVSDTVGEYSSYEDLTETGAKIWAGHVAAHSSTSMTVDWIAIGTKA